MYADDTVLLTSGENVENVMESNEIFFNRYVEWTTRNVSKTKHMILCTKSVDMKIHIKMNTVDISNAVLYKHMSCNLDRNLTLEPFVKDIIQRVCLVKYVVSLLSMLLY